MEALTIRYLLAPTRQDPGYYSLKPRTEPRAALLLNRFTRTLTIMYATSEIKQVIGFADNDIRGWSLYCFVAECCLGRVVRCLETAKRDDSIAYLRFWFREHKSRVIYNTQQDQHTAPSMHAPGPVCCAWRRTFCHAIELEAVVFCTSDGLAVVIRRSCPLMSAHVRSYP